MKYILFRHKPDKVYDLFSVQLRPEKVANIILIKEALKDKVHIKQSRGGWGGWEEVVIFWK